MPWLSIIQNCPFENFGKWQPQWLVVALVE